MEEIKVYTIRQVADILQVSYRTVQNYIYSGKLKAFKMAGNGRYRVTAEALKEFTDTKEEAK